MDFRDLFKNRIRPVVLTISGFLFGTFVTFLGMRHQATEAEKKAYDNGREAAEAEISSHEREAFEVGMGIGNTQGRVEGVLLGLTAAIKEFAPDHLKRLENGTLTFNPDRVSYTNDFLRAVTPIIPGLRDLSGQTDPEGMDFLYKQLSVMEPLQVLAEKYLTKDKDSKININLMVRELSPVFDAAALELLRRHREQPSPRGTDVESTTPQRLPYEYQDV